MMSRDAAKGRSNKDSHNGKLVHAIESISKALYFDKSPSRSSPSLSRNTSTAKQVSDTKDKKKSIWKTLKGFSHVPHQRFNCCFTLEIHSIEGLPSKYNDLGICVHWERKKAELVTNRILVNQGIAEFNQKLTHTCSVSGSGNGPHHSVKYGAKHFLLYAAIDGNPKLDLGKHHIDLTRILPLTLEELEDGKSSEAWKTSFKLSGEAKGAVMNVSFCYELLAEGIASKNKNVLQHLDSKETTNNFVKLNQRDPTGFARRLSGSLPANQKPSKASRSMDDISSLHEGPPTRSGFCNSINILYQKLEEEQVGSPVDVKHEIVGPSADYYEPVISSDGSPAGASKGQFLNECDNTDFSIAEKGLDLEEKSGVNVEYRNEVPIEYSEYSPSDQFVQQIANKCEDAEYTFAEKGLDLEKKSEVDVKYRSEAPIKRSECFPSDKSEGNIVNKCKDAENPFAERGLDFQEETELNENEINIIDKQDENREEHTGGHDDVENAFYREGNITKTAVINYCSMELDESEAHIIDKEDDKRDERAGFHDDAGNSFWGEGNINKTEVIHDFTKESLLEDLGSVLSHVVELEKDGMDTSEARSESSVHNCQNTDKARKMMPSHSSEDLMEYECRMVEVDELSASFNSDVKPDSPRERLLREFLKEAEASGCSLFGYDSDDGVVNVCYAPITSTCEEPSEDSDSSPVHQSEYPKIRVKAVEDLETPELVEWGPPLRIIANLGSPIDLSPRESSLPPLGKGLGPFIQTKSGGFMRLMNPGLFRSAKSGGALIMQVSRPVVIPTELGSGVIDVLQQLASMGLEKLSSQAKEMMSLDDITGNTIQQMAWEAVPQMEASTRQNLLPNEQDSDQTISSPKPRKSTSSSISDEDSECVSLEDLAPLAMNKIEELSIEGLRIQSGMSDEEAPSNITVQTIVESVSPTGYMGLEGAAGLQLFGLKETVIDNNDGDGLMDLSLTLDEWMRLDSGEIDDDQPSERTLKILAAHHASSTDLNILCDKNSSKASRRRGLFSNNLTVALMVQLRNPFRDYEPVGTPMLALIQVERSFIPQHSRLYCMVKTQEDDNWIPQFKINGVHVAGFEGEPNNNKPWGSSAQQQSGSRWLLANGMSKSGNKSPLVKPKIFSKYQYASITSQSADTLWSISGRYSEGESKWPELASLNPYIRNPNIILSNETIKFC